jgi:pimeloyl-ACP methyl ester carboxylesterase
MSPIAGSSIGTDLGRERIRPAMATVSELLDQLLGPMGGQRSPRTAALMAAYTGGVLTPVSGPDLEAYLAPFPTRDSRRPVLAWSRQLPIDGEPAELVERITTYDRWLAASVDVPKLLMTFEGSPTLLVDEAVATWCALNVACLDIVGCGAAGHHAAEDRPEEIAAAITLWCNTWLDESAPVTGSLPDVTASNLPGATKA